MPPMWDSPPEAPPPPGSPARDVIPELYAAVDPLWLIRLSATQQLAVFRSICIENGWYERHWPQIAKVVRRGTSAPPNDLTPSQRSQQARLAADRSWAYTVVPAERTAPARKALLERFEHQVDPERTLRPQQRKRMAESAKKAYFRGLALKSSRRRSSAGA